MAKCAAIQVPFELADGASREIIFRLGVGQGSGNASRLVQRLLELETYRCLALLGLSAARGGFDRAEAHLSRVSMNLDEQGWKDVAKAYYGLLREKVADALAMADTSRKDATALLKNRREHDFNELAAALLAGYRSLRPIDTTELPLFLALRSLTYVGWIISRLDEDNSAARNARNIAVAVALSEAYLAS